MLHETARGKWDHAVRIEGLSCSGPPRPLYYRDESVFRVKVWCAHFAGWYLVSQHIRTWFLRITLDHHELPVGVGIVGPHLLTGLETDKAVLIRDLVRISGVRR